MVEGYVLQKALLLRDIAAASRNFDNLRVFLDTRIVLQVLGYQDDAARVASIQMVDLLKRRNARVEVFQDTLDEITRIFHVYESKLGSQKGRESLYGNPLTRYFLNNGFTPADVRSRIATLNKDVQRLGLPVRKRPSREASFTLDEKALATSLGADDVTDVEHRVWHDVNCVAAILTWRRGFETEQIEAAKAVFVTSTGLVVKNVRQWWQQQRKGIPGSSDSTRLLPPVIHQITLSNYVWLKKPHASEDLKLN